MFSELFWILELAPRELWPRLWSCFCRRWIFSHKDLVVWLGVWNAAFQACWVSPWRGGGIGSRSFSSHLYLLTRRGTVGCFGQLSWGPLASTCPGWIPITTANRWHIQNRSFELSCFPCRVLWNEPKPLLGLAVVWSWLQADWVKWNIPWLIALLLLFVKAFQEPL